MPRPQKSYGRNTLGGDNSDDLRISFKLRDGGFLFGGTSDSGLSGDKTEVSMGLMTTGSSKQTPWKH